MHFRPQSRLYLPIIYPQMDSNIVWLPFGRLSRTSFSTCYDSIKSGNQGIPAAEGLPQAGAKSFHEVRTCKLLAPQTVTVC